MLAGARICSIHAPLLIRLAKLGGCSVGERTCSLIQSQANSLLGDNNVFTYALKIP